eukprot:gene16971-biopygen25889
MIFKAQESHAKNMYGITQNIFLVNNTINIHVGGGTDDDSLSSSSITEDVLAEKLMEASPEFFSRIKFVPEIKKKECVGDTPYYDPATNRWSNCSNMRISKLIKIEFTSTFPVEKNNKTNEKLRWFVDTVMPVDEERDVVLAFFAGLLPGQRKEKKFLAFTDKTSGDNGKSTLMALMCNFFGEYGSSNGTKFLTKGSFARGRDDHDAGLKPMKGVRLLVAEEMKPNTALDEALIKRIAGGEGVRVCGRSCGTGNSFDFIWQAGVVMIFNEGDCPKFDGGDNAFVKRMVVVPMRSNFLIHPDPQREHEFERRDDLADILPTWRSALAQLLIEHFRRPGRSSIFDTLPVAMTEWKSGIADSANPLAEWLEEVVEVTGASSDAVWIGDLKSRWKVSHYGHETSSVFSTKLVKAFCLGKQGTEWKETSQVAVSTEEEKKKVVKRGVIRGIKLVGSS